MGDSYKLASVYNRLFCASQRLGTPVALHLLSLKRSLLWPGPQRDLEAMQGMVCS